VTISFVKKNIRILKCSSERGPRYKFSHRVQRKLKCIISEQGKLRVRAVFCSLFYDAFSVARLYSVKRSILVTSKVMMRVLNRIADIYSINFPTF
jgi:hypothetical protein